MTKKLSNLLQLTLLLLLMQQAACKPAPAKKDQPPPPAPPSCLLLTGEFIYGRPKEIMSTTISDHLKPSRDTATFDWVSRKVVYLGDVTYLGADLRPDSSVSIDKTSLQHFFKTPYYKEYRSYSRTNEPAEYHFHYELDTAKRQVREVEAPADTSEYSIDYFSAEGFLIHRFVKLNKKDFYHLYYTNDNHGNPVEERIVIKNIDLIQEKYEYEYDKEGNWVVKDLYHFYPDGQSFKMQFRRKIAY